MAAMTSEFRIPAPLQNTIDNLAFLASTQIGEKLYFKEKSHIVDSDWAARARRWYNNENLSTQIKIIKEIIELGLESIKLYEQSVHFIRLIQEFSKAKDGLYNLRNTYLKQNGCVTDIDTQIYIMENQISALPIEIKKRAGILNTNKNKNNYNENDNNTSKVTSESSDSNSSDSEED